MKCGNVVYRRKVAFVIGGAKNVWTDLKQAYEICGKPDYRVVVNDMGVEFQGDIDCWVSYHPDLLLRWIEKREKANLKPAAVLYVGTSRGKKRPEHAKVLNTRGGSSGMLATYAALKEGATHVILSGVPIDPTLPNIFNKVGTPWVDGRHYQMHWKRDYKKLRVKVRSMSGFTRELLGEPTQIWLEEQHV